MTPVYRRLRRRLWVFADRYSQTKSFDSAIVAQLKADLIAQEVYDLYGALVYIVCGHYLIALDYEQADRYLAEIEEMAQGGDLYLQVYFHLLTGLSLWFRTGVMSQVLEHYTAAEELLSQIDKPE